MLPDPGGVPTLSPHRCARRLPYPALSIPGFIRVLIGDSISQLGNSAYILAASLWIYQLTGRVGPIAGLWVARVVARLVFQPWAGAWVDRWDRRRTLLATNVLSAAVVSLFPLAGRERVWMFYGLTAVVQVVNDFLAPAHNAWIPDVVPPDALLSANALLAAGGGTVGFLGPALMGLLYRSWGPRVLFWLDGGSFLVAAAAVASASRPLGGGGHPLRLPKKRRPSLWQEAGQGLGWMVREPLMRSILALLLVNSLMWRVLEILLVPLANSHWNVGAVGLGLLYSLLAAGQLVAGLVLGRTAWTGTRPLIAAAFGAEALLLLTILGGPPLVDMGAAAAGIVAGIAAAWIGQLVQTKVPEGLRGRAFAATSLATAVGVLPALAVLGPAVHALGDIGVSLAAIALLLGASAWLARTGRGRGDAAETAGGGG